jgi:hypothetical protein
MEGINLGHNRVKGLAVGVRVNENSCRMRAVGEAVAAHRAAMGVVNLFLDTQLKYKNKDRGNMGVKMRGGN